MRQTILALAFLVAAPILSWAKDPIQVCEGGTCRGSNQRGIIEFADNYERDPRDLTLLVFEHAFIFDVTGPGPNCGAACTSLRFTSSELGVDQTFTGADTAEVSAKFKAFLRNGSFLKAFIRLMNAGPGAQMTGSPVGSVGMTTRFTFQDMLFSNVRTLEEKRGIPPGKDPALSGGFGRFNDRGYSGENFSVSPGFTLDFGESRDKHLKFTVPLSQLSVEGLKTYRAGLVTQYQHPIYFEDNLTLNVGPGLSYVATGSLDLPNFSGLIGGAASATLNKDWKRWIGTLGSYYGYFQNLGGIDTDIVARVAGWGAQTGYRVTERTVAAVYLIGMHENAVGFGTTSYSTVGLSYSFRIAGRFNMTLSGNKTFGLSNRRFAEVGMGTAWFF